MSTPAARCEAAIAALKRAISSPANAESVEELNKLAPEADPKVDCVRVQALFRDFSVITARSFVDRVQAGLSDRNKVSGLYRSCKNMSIAWSWAKMSETRKVDARFAVSAGPTSVDSDGGNHFSPYQGFSANYIANLFGYLDTERFESNVVWLSSLPFWASPNGDTASRSL